MRELVKHLVKFKDVNKSTIFLYAMLQLKTKAVEPIGTYLNIKDCSIYKDMNLICMFHKQQKGFETIDQELRTHTLFDFYVDDTESYRYYIMDFSTISGIYKAVVEGKYSELTSNAKQVINITGHPVGVIGVNPQLYYEEFSEEFNVSIEKLRSDIELLGKPDEQNETLSLPDNVKQLFL